MKCQQNLGIDGGFFKADAGKDSIYTEDKLHQQLQQLGQKIKAYQGQLALQDEADNQAGLGSLIEARQLNGKITALKGKQATKKAKDLLASKNFLITYKVQLLVASKVAEPYT